LEPGYQRGVPHGPRYSGRPGLDQLLSCLSGPRRLWRLQEIRYRPGNPQDDPGSLPTDQEPSGQLRRKPAWLLLKPTDKPAEGGSDTFSRPLRRCRCFSGPSPPLYRCLIAIKAPACTTLDHGCGIPITAEVPMRAMSLRKIGGPLELIDCPAARPGTGELRLQVEACGVCRTDLHVVDGELTGGKLPLIPGHEIV